MVSCDAMLRVKDITQCRAYVYINPEDNFRLEDQFYWRLEDRSKEYRRVNQYPIGSAWKDEFEANVCAHSGAACHEDLPPLVTRAKTLVQESARWARSGFKTRTKEQAEEILAKFCRPCVHYGGEKGLLRIHCKLCGCSSKKTYLLTSHCAMNPPLW